MQVSDIDSVKIFNLSGGKSLPDWLSDRRRRAILRKNVDLRKQINLIQDFEMPGISTSIRLSPNGKFILATGIYKPRVRCYDVNNLSLKFERCMDSEVVTFEVLSEDYAKLVFLQCDRYLEFHIGHGRHYRLRVPKFGRDIAYHKPSCDLFVVGASSDIYRLNLEAGQFMSPYVTSAKEINCCRVSEEHGLLVVGTDNGHIEAWDPRTRNMQAKVDCSQHCFSVDSKMEEYPSITSLQFKDGLTMAAGTATGHVIIYDIRSNKPLLIKDHMNGLPIKSIFFHKDLSYVYSMDGTVVKIWNENTGKHYTAIEGTVEFNDLCVIPGTGISLMANEDKKMQIYYVPSLGPAPRWCAFLDNLTEELESVASQTMYDDYKFVTKQELEALGLDHLMGTNLLRAYMHGFFVDIRLYKKAKSISDPFAFETYKKQKIKEKLHENRPDRLIVHSNLPEVNRELAMKLMSDQTHQKKKKSNANLLSDERFQAMFQNPDFEVDKTTEEFRLLNPVLSKLDKYREKEALIQQKPADIQDNLSEEDKLSNNEFYDESDSSSDEQMKPFNKKKSQKIQRGNRESGDTSTPKFSELKEDRGLLRIKPKHSKASLGERLKLENHGTKITHLGGNKEMKFKMRSSKDKLMKQEHDKKHKEDRKKIFRKTEFLLKPLRIKRY